MSDRKDVVAVASGLPYLVVSVNGHPPESLDDFAEDGVTTVRASSHEQVITFHGSGRREEDCVLIYEKDQAGIGKDVRIWSIASRDGHFDAIERCIY
jgi:hypothetical protein